MSINVSISSEALEEFYEITGSNMRQYLINVDTFLLIDYTNITNFYQGLSKDIKKDAFENFESIKQQTKDILQKFQLFNTQLQNVKFIEMLEMIERCNDALETLNNINKWARVSTDLFGYNPNFKVDYVLSQNDNLEKVSQQVAISNNPQDDWANIAIDNYLEEENYTSEGGGAINVTRASDNIANLGITSIVDTVKGKSVYGKDVDRFIQFDVANQDLKVLNEDDTINQALIILSSLRKRDNLDFLDNGLQSSLIIGKNKNLLNFPVIERQLQDSFNNDDTFKNFSLIQYRVEQDNIFIDFSVETRLGEVLELTYNLSE